MDARTTMLATASASVVRQGCIVEDGSPADATTNSDDATICFMEEEHWNCYLSNILPLEALFFMTASAKISSMEEEALELSSVNMTGSMEALYSMTLSG